MRVSIIKSNGRLFESQSGGDSQEHLDALLQNAINAGFSSEEVEVKFATDEEYAVILAAEKSAEEEALPDPEKKRRAYRQAWTEDEFQEAFLEAHEDPPRPGKLNVLLQKRAAIHGA